MQRNTKGTRRTVKGNRADRRTAASQLATLLVAAELAGTRR
jgi:hypothetical protein